MSEFLTQSALAERLVSKAGVSPETAKKFSTLFFTIIKKGLKESDSFAIYNFGTFKKTWIETTMGLNPQTGVKIEIPAHWRIKFVPCRSVARRINRPYAHLKPKVLKEPKVPKSAAVSTASESEKSKDIDAKVGPDGLYAKASKIAEGEAPDEERMGLLAAAENLRAENAIKEAEGNEDKNELLSDDETQISDFDNIPENSSEEKPEAAPVSEDSSSEDDFEENESDPSVVENEDDDDFDDDDIAEENSKKPVKILVLAGAAVIIIVLLISLLIRSCSGKAQSAKKEPEDNSKKEPETLVTEPVNNEESEKDSDEDETVRSNQDSSTESKEPETQSTVSPDYTEISADELFESFVVPSGGTLHKIAEQKYENRHLWPLIYSANKEKYPDPDFIGSYANIKVPEKPEGAGAEKKIASAMLDAYNGYLLMCEKQPDSGRNEERRNRAVRVIVSGELVQEGFIEANRARILPEYADLAMNIVKNQYKK